MPPANNPIAKIKTYEHFKAQLIRGWHIFHGVLVENSMVGLLRAGLIRQYIQELIAVALQR